MEAIERPSAAATPGAPTPIPRAAIPRRDSSCRHNDRTVSIHAPAAAPSRVWARASSSTSPDAETLAALTFVPPRSMPMA